MAYRRSTRISDLLRPGTVQVKADQGNYNRTEIKPYAYDISAKQSSRIHI